MFGATGSTNIYDDRRQTLRNGVTHAGLSGVALMFVGLGFKVAAAPFHVWTPDVYEGAPSPVVAFMSTAPKAAAFAVLLRIMFATDAPGWFWLIWVAAALSMTHRQPRRAGAEQRQAHAGLLLDRARRISAGGVRGAAKDIRHLRRHVLHRLLRRHERGRVRR